MIKITITDDSGKTIDLKLLNWFVNSNAYHINLQAKTPQVSKEELASIKTMLKQCK